MESYQQVRSRLKLQYGYDIGDSGAMIVLVLERVTAQYLASIDQAVDRIDTSQQSFQTNNKWVGFWYALGRSLPWALVGLLVVLLAAYGYWQHDATRQARADLARYEQVLPYRILVERGRLIQESNGWVSLVVRPIPRRKPWLPGQHYRFVPGSQAVVIPLYSVRSPNPLSP